MSVPRIEKRPGVGFWHGKRTRIESVYVLDQMFLVSGPCNVESFGRIEPSHAIELKLCIVVQCGDGLYEATLRDWEERSLLLDAALGKGGQQSRRRRSEALETEISLHTEHCEAARRRLCCRETRCNSIVWMCDAASCWSLAVCPTNKFPSVSSPVDCGAERTILPSDRGRARHFLGREARQPPPANHGSPTHSLVHFLKQRNRRLQQRPSSHSHTLLPVIGYLFRAATGLCCPIERPAPVGCYEKHTAETPMAAAGSKVA